MNIKIAKTLLVLCIIYIIGFYILKYIFPEYLLLTITDENILRFGAFIEKSIVTTYLLNLITTFVTFYLFVAACKGQFKLSLFELVILLLAVAVNFAITEFVPSLMAHTSTSLMLLLALITKGKMINSIITFIVHGYLAQFLFSIRGFDTIITEINIASGVVLAIETYVWLFLFALIFYLKEKKNGTLCTTISRQTN